MVRRSLGAALWFFAGLLACFLGALSALVGTGAGRELLARVTEESLADALDGSVAVGDIGGTLITSLTLTDLRLFDRDSSLVVWLPHAELSYNPFDLAAGRIVLLALDLRRPLFNLQQYPDGRLNLKEVLRLGRPSTEDGPERPSPLIMFRNVAIDRGELILQERDEPSPDDSLHEISEPGPGERLRVRRFAGIDARLNLLRLSSPRESGILAEIRHLALASSDPGFRLLGAHGRLLVMGDSLDADLDNVRLPGSSLAARGRVRWPSDTVLYNLDLAVDSATLEDFRFIDARFPEGAVLGGDLLVRSRTARILEVRLDPVDVVYHGGALSGRATAISAAGEGLVALRHVDLVTTELDLELARPFLDSLPFAGRLSGRTVADGRMDALGLQVEWVFRDSLVEGWPVTRVRGRGEVNLEHPDGLAFHEFAIDLGEFDLASVRRLIPAFLLLGTLDANGRIEGPYTNAQFDGSLRHRHAGPAASIVHGTLRIDNRTDTLGVFADVVADSLVFEELAASFPGLPLAGAVRGPIRLAGRVDRLDTHFELTSANGGTVRGDGFLTLVPPHYGARDFVLDGRDVSLARWIARAPRSRISARVAGSFDADSAVAPTGRVTALLEPSMLAGALLDSGTAVVRFADEQVIVDSLRVVQAGLVTTGRGGLSWTRPTRGSLALELESDTLAALDSLVRWVGERTGSPPELLADPIEGAARASVLLSGAFDSLAVEARVEGQALAWRDLAVTRGDAALRWQPGTVPGIALDVTLDSLAWNDLGFGAASAAVAGTMDSLTWFARSRIGDLSAFLGGGRLRQERDSAGTATLAVDVDSLAVLVPGGVWFLSQDVRAVVSDSVTSVSTLTLSKADGAGRLTIEGNLPRRGYGNASVQLESFPVQALYGLLQRDTAGVGGSLTATVSVEGSRIAPVYQGSFSLAEGAFGQFHTPFVDGTVTYRDRRLDGDLHLWRSGQQIMTVAAHLPLDLSLVQVPTRQLPESLSVRALADSVDLSLLEAVTPLVRQVRGGLTADFGIRGTWEAPRLSGEVRIVDAGAFIPSVNVRYDEISGQFRLSGDTIGVTALTLRGGEGRAEVTGSVRLASLNRPLLALDIEANEFRALDLRGLISVTASGRLALRGPVFGAELTGRGTVTSGVWYFADLVRKRVVNIDAPWATILIDTSLAATIRRQRLGPEFQSVFLDSLRIQDLNLAMGSDVWLRSNEANIQLTGTVRASKRGSDYLLTGTLQAPRGVYRLTIGPVTRDFTVTQGTVRYFGTPDLNAELDIEARHVVHPVQTQTGRADDVAITAHIGGTLLVPRLTLEAEGRELAQTEIISYLLFGQPSVELAGDQGASQQALVRSALASVYGELERTLVSDLGVPLDYVEIRPSNPAAPWEGTRFAAGWQLGEKTFLVLKAGFCAGQQIEVTKALGASLQFRISPEVRAEASFEPVFLCGATGQTAISQNQQAGFDLLWERRY